MNAAIAMAVLLKKLGKRRCFDFWWK